MVPVLLERNIKMNLALNLNENKKNILPLFAKWHQSKIKMEQFGDLRRSIKRKLINICCSLEKKVYDTRQKIEM